METSNSVKIKFGLISSLKLKESIKDINKRLGRKVYMLIKRPVQTITDRDLQKSVSFMMQNTFKKGESNIGSVISNQENNLVENEKGEFKKLISTICQNSEFNLWNGFLTGNKGYIQTIYQLGKESDNVSLVNFDEVLENNEEIANEKIRLASKVGITMEEYFIRLVNFMESTGEYIVITKDDAIEVNKILYNNFSSELSKIRDIDTSADHDAALSVLREQGFII